MYLTDISNIIRKARAHAERRLASYNIGFPEQLVLMSLYAHGPTNQETIAATIDIDRGAIAKTIAKLESKGYITRYTNDNNKREKIVKALPAAEGVIEQMMASYEEMERQLFIGFSPEEKQQVCDYLARISENASLGSMR